MREFVENALDAAESIGVLPTVDVSIDEISAARFATLVGLAPGARVDEALYEDAAAAAEQAKREAAAEKRRLAAALRKKAQAEEAGTAPRPDKEPKEPKESKSRAPSGPIYYKVTVKDNGKGMAHADIPNMLGVVLSGTKYGVRQARGKFGLGAKMALIWAKQTTGQPIEVRSCPPGQSFVSRYRLDLDLRANAPRVHACEKLPNPEGWHGTEISVLIRGSWSSYRNKIITYLRQLAVITPYSELCFRYNSEAGGKRSDVGLRFRRRTQYMPPQPTETAYHPSAVNLETIHALMRGTACKTMRAFLCKEFTCIDSALAERLLAECGHGISAGLDPKALQPAQVMALHRLFAAAKFEAPSGDCLSPAGEYNMRLGVIKELRPELVATYCGPPAACEGHPFMVEAAVSLGGRDVKQGLNVFRFANRIPLLFEPGSDVVVKQAQDIDWGRYKIDKTSAKLGIFVSVVSTRIPFRGTGKEHIAEDVKEIAEEVRRALQHCGNQLSKKLAKRHAAKQRKARAKALVRYIPDVARAVFGVLHKMAERDDPPAKRRRLASDAAAESGAPEPREGALDADLVGAVQRRDVTLDTLRSKLEQHIEQADQNQGTFGRGLLARPVSLTCRCSAGIFHGIRPSGGHQARIARGVCVCDSALTQVPPQPSLPGANQRPTHLRPSGHHARDIAAHAAVSEVRRNTAAATNTAAARATSFAPRSLRKPVSLRLLSLRNLCPRATLCSQSEAVRALSRC